MARCLRSGACCVSFRVHGVPGYINGVKAEFEQCIHLVPAHPDADKCWHKASCVLHGTPQFPDECARFDFPGPSDQCALGQAIWRARGVVEIEKDLAD